MHRTYAGALWQTQKLPRGTDSPMCAEVKRGHPPTILTEAEVLECRAKHDFYHWSVDALADEFGTSVLYMRRLIDGVTRANLIAKPEHANLTN